MSALGYVSGSSNTTGGVVPGATGDLIVADSQYSWARLASAGAGHTLSATATVPRWTLAADRYKPRVVAYDDLDWTHFFGAPNSAVWLPVTTVLSSTKHITSNYADGSRPTSALGLATFAGRALGGDSSANLTMLETASTLDPLQDLDIQTSVKVAAGSLSGHNGAVWVMFYWDDSNAAFLMWGSSATETVTLVSGVVTVDAPTAFTESALPAAPTSTPAALTLQLRNGIVRITLGAVLVGVLALPPSLLTQRMRIRMGGGTNESVTGGETAAWGALGPITIAVYPVPAVAYTDIYVARAEGDSVMYAANLFRLPNGTPAFARRAAGGVLRVSQLDAATKSITTTTTTTPGVESTACFCDETGYYLVGSNSDAAYIYRCADATFSSPALVKTIARPSGVTNTWLSAWSEHVMLKVGGSYFLYFTAIGPVHSIGVLTATTLTGTWSGATQCACRTPLVTPQTGLSTPSVMYDTATRTFHMLVDAGNQYNGQYLVGSFVSADGLHFLPTADYALVCEQGTVPYFGSWVQMDDDTVLLAWSDSGTRLFLRQYNSASHLVDRALLL